MYPKARLEALSDGIFAVAMTLLVLDIRLPDDFHPHHGHELIIGLLALTPKLIPYVISFFVLGLRWLSNLRAKPRSETVSSAFARVWLGYHFLITAVPFTTIVLGRFPDSAPSIWLYAGNTALLASLALWMIRLAPDTEEAEATERRISLLFLMGSSAIAVSLQPALGASCYLGIDVEFLRTSRISCSPRPSQFGTQTQAAGHTLERMISRRKRCRCARFDRRNVDVRSAAMILRLCLRAQPPGRDGNRTP